MGYRPRHPPHRRRRGCPVCTRQLEVELGMRPAPQPPKGPGGGSPHA